MLVYFNEGQEASLKHLRETHIAAAADRRLVLGDLIKKLCDALRGNIQNEPVQVTRDGLLGSLRRIELAYSEYGKHPFESYEDFEQGSAVERQDRREAWLFVFFHNYKCFLEILKKCYNKIYKNQDGLLGEVTAIRDFFAHSYEKDFIGREKMFVRLNPYPKAGDELLELEVFDLDSRKVHSVFFSMEYYFLEVKTLTNKLAKHITANV